MHVLVRRHEAAAFFRTCGEHKKKREGGFLLVHELCGAGVFRGPVSSSSAKTHFLWNRKRKILRSVLLFLVPDARGLLHGIRAGRDMQRAEPGRGIHQCSFHRDALD